MKVYQADQIKNLALLGGSGSGKTTLAEAMLFEGGVIKRRGDVESIIQYLIITESSMNMATRFFHPFYSQNI